MKHLPTGTLREFARFCLDLSKLTATAAFITPCFTTVNIESHITVGMASAAMTTFLLGISLHYLTDHLEQEHKPAQQEERLNTPKKSKKKTKR